MRALVLLLVLGLLACEDKAPSADVDYDAINRHAEGPAREIQPEPITTGQLSGLGLEGASCIVPASEHRQNLFAATARIGVMKIDSEILEFAPKPTLNPLPHDISDTYDGLAYTIELSLDQSSETPAGPELFFYNGILTVRDHRERTVFEHRGRVECGG